MTTDHDILPPSGSPPLIWLTDRARQRLFRETDRLLQDEVGISIAHASALIMIGQDSPMAMRDLALALDIGQPAVTGLTRRMEDRGLVRRAHDPKDGRVQRLMLTDKGRSARDHATRVIDGVNARLEASVPAGQLAAVTGFLERLAQGQPLVAEEVDSGEPPRQEARSG